MNYIMISSGEYSDYRVNYLIATEKPVSKTEVIELYRMATKMRGDDREKVRALTYQRLQEKGLPAGRTEIGVFGTVDTFDSREYSLEEESAKKELGIKFEEDYFEKILAVNMKECGYIVLDYTEINTDYPER